MIRVKVVVVVVVDLEEFGVAEDSKFDQIL